MNNKLQAGDLAIIIKSMLGKNIGRIVECVLVESVLHPDFGAIWLVRSSRKDLVDESGGVGDTFHVPQDWLRKIPNDPLPDDEDAWELDPTKELELVK
jgi:hypothetical protein